MSSKLFICFSQKKNYLFVLYISEIKISDLFLHRKRTNTYFFLKSKFETYMPKKLDYFGLLYIVKQRLNISDCKPIEDKLAYKPKSLNFSSAHVSQ